MTGARRLRVVVIGLGNTDRGDDAVGPIVAGQAARMAGLDPDGGPPADAVDLLDRWHGADLAIVVDAVRSGDAPGTVRVLRPSDDDVLPSRGASTHGMGLACALRLSRAVGNAPRAVVLVGIEGQSFATGGPLSRPVAEVVPEAVRTVVGLIEEAQQCA